MFSFSKIRRFILVVFLLGIPLLLLRSSFQEPYAMSPFDRAVRRVGAPLEAGIGYSFKWVASLFERWIFQAQMMDEKIDLESELREAKRALVEIQQLREENRQLRRSLQVREQAPEDLLSAEVLGVEQSPFFRAVKLRLDRGDAFIQPGMAVLSADGIVGRIQRAQSDYSDVMLITDPQSKIAVEVARTRCPGILVGATEDSCSVRVIRCDQPVEVGDVIQTSGVDDLFPKGHPVGRVTKVEDKTDGQWVEVLPSVRFDRLEVVWVVLAPAPADDPEAGSLTPLPKARGIQPIR